MKLDFLNIEQREAKPRINGLTIIEDKGYSLKEVSDTISNYSSIIDYVRLSPSSLLSDTSLKEKVFSYTNLGIIPLISGLIFEKAFLSNKLEEYKEFLKANKIEWVEISDGIIEIKPEKKAEIIKDFSKDFNVLSKVGPTSKDDSFPIEKWKEYIDAEINAGSKNIIIEGGEGGLIRIVNDIPEIKKYLVETLSKSTNIDNIIWETEDIKFQQWFIESFGKDVNLASVNANDVLNLESLRLGLNSETFLQNLPEKLYKDKVRKLDPMYNFDWQI